MGSVTTDRLAGVNASVAIKAPVAAATTANIALSDAQTIDGVAVVADDRVLVKDQTDGIENGIYDVKSGAWVRALDFDGVRDVVTGTVVHVINGGAGAGLWFELTTTGDITIGTTSLAFATITPTAAYAAIIDTFLATTTAATALASIGGADLTTVNTFTKTQSWSKGADVASASPLVLGTDGNYFDVTGTTGIDEITVVAGTFFMLQFDGIVELTHDGTQLDLPGGANITTAAGDVLLGFATIANKVQVLVFTRAADADVTLARSYLAGLQLSVGTDTDHDIDIAVGECRNADDDENIALTSVFTKQIDVTWAAGSAAGGLSSSLTAPANTTWYHVFAIKVGGSADVGFDTSITAANLVADHSATAYRHIGFVRTDGSANILGFIQIGNYFSLGLPVLDFNSTIGTTAASQTLTAPPGTIARVRSMSTSSGGHAANLSPLSISDTAPSLSAAPLGNSIANSANDTGQGEIEIEVDAISQIRIDSSVASTTLRIVTFGWIDTRGRDA